MNISEVIVGDTLTFRTSVPDYPATGGNTLKYRLVPRAAGTAIVLTATASGADYLINEAAATTAAWAAGEYAWYSYIESGSARYTVGQGQITLKPNPAAVAAGTDTRSQAQIALAAAKLALASWSPTRKSYQIGDVAMTFNSPAEIIRVISHWETAVAREEAALAMASGRKPARRVYIRSARG